jgi:VanZ family protein
MLPTDSPPAKQALDKTETASGYYAHRQRQHAKFLVVFAILASVTLGLGWLVPPSLSLPTFYLLTGAWAVFGCRTAAFLWQHGHRKSLWISVGLMLILGVGVALPAGIIRYLLQPFDRVINFLNEQLPNVFFFRGASGKVAHVFCFAGLALVTLLNRNRLSVSKMHWVIGFMLLATATESIQLFLKGRSATLRDAGFDAIGVVLGMVIYSIIRLGQRMRTNEDE